jgi:hypothetical protein
MFQLLKLLEFLMGPKIILTLSDLVESCAQLFIHIRDLLNMLTLGEK